MLDHKMDSTFDLELEKLQFQSVSPYDLKPEHKEFVQQIQYSRIPIFDLH